MWGFLSTSHSPIAANENLANKPYFFRGVLSNLAGFLRPLYPRSIILGLFDHFFNSQYGISLITLHYFWPKLTLSTFYVIPNTSETGHSNTLETDSPSLNEISCTCCMGYNNVIKFLLFYGVIKGDSTSGNMMFSNFLVWDYMIHFNSALSKLELIQYMVYYLTLVTP